jgi:hypothetical protein
MTAEVANVATGTDTSQERLYVMVSRSREGTRIHALRAEIEEMGAVPAHLEPPPQNAAVEASQPAQVVGAQLAEPAAREPTSPARIRAGMTAAELTAQIEASRADREARAEYATIREISQHARSEAKQAAGPATWSQPADPRAAMHLSRDVRTQALQAEQALTRADFAQHSRPAEPAHDRATSAVMRHTPGSDEIRATTRQHLQERLETAQQAHQERDLARIPESMPARSATESVARLHAEQGNTTEALAFYRMLGRLDFAEHPEQAAVERASQQPGSLIVAEDQRQRDRLLQLLRERSEPAQWQGKGQLERSNEKPTQAPPTPPEQPTIVLAEDLYRQRFEQRELWVDRVRESQRQGGRNPEAFEHHVEPGAIDQAIVVVNSPSNAHSLARGVSGPAEAHLITGQPDWLTSEAVRLRADRLTIAQQARAQEASQRQSAEAAQQLQEQALEHSATRAAEHSAEHNAQPTAEHAGAER